MKYFLSSLIFAACLMVSTFPIFSDVDNLVDYRFDKMNFPDRMNSSVSGILQDSSGFIWFATQGGLHRYDGYKLETFTNDPFNTSSISHNLIQTLYIAPDGIIWLGTYGGLNRFDPSTGIASVYENDPEDSASLSNEVVTSIMMDDNGLLWVGTLNGLNKLDPQTGVFKRYFHDEDDDSSLPHDSVRDIMKDSLGRLWLATYSGLALYRPDTDDFATWKAGESGNTFHSPFIMSIAQDSQNSDILWLGSWGGGISSFSISTGKITNYELPDDRIYRILIDSRGRLWAASWGGGLIEFDRDTGLSRVFKSEGNNGLSHDVVYSLFEDASGILWIGTNGGGVNRLKDWENRYKHLEHQPSSENSLAPGKVLSIHESDDGYIWFGVYEGGVSRFEPFSGEFKNFNHDDENPETLSDDIVNKLFVDSQGTLWAATNAGLNIYDPDSETFSPFLLESENPAPVVYDIFETAEGELWIGRYLKGITVLDKDYSTITEHHYIEGDSYSLSDNLVRAIQQQKDGKIWVGTNKGLNLYDPETGNFRHFFHDSDDISTISSDNIYDLYIDSHERLWIATQGGGINLYDPETESFTYLLDQDGLSSNMSHAVMQASDHEFLFGSKLGLSIFNEETGTFRTIDSRTGLLSEELMSNILKASDGSYYVGSIKGVTIIKPDEQTEKPRTPKLALTGFNVLGAPYSGASKPWLLEEVTLEHDQNYISFEFSAFDFSSPENNNYAYMLEGFDDDWNYSESRNYATYTNLKPGTYIFKFIGSGSLDNWNKNPAGIRVNIQPPFWQTAIAKVFYFIIAVIMLFLIGVKISSWLNRSKILLEKRESDNMKLEEVVRERTFEIEESRKAAEAAAIAKSRFLANMSHEIRTPLNAIVGFTDLIMDTQIDKKQEEYISNITNSSNFLLNTINEILDFSKIEAGKVTLEELPFNVRDISHDLNILFSVSAKNKNLKLSIYSEENVPATISGDQHRLKQILHNLISNAIKFTDEGQVSVRISIGNPSDEHICFEVRDTGIGIAEEKIEHLFDSFNQADTSTSRLYGGTGLGLSITKQLVDAMNGTISIESEEGHGSVFSVCIPFKQVDFHSTAPMLSDESAKAFNFKAKPGQKILAVEDNQLNQMVIKEYLNKLEFEVTIADSGKECLEQLKRHNDYDLIFMDIQMPGMDGNETTRLIRGMGNKIPIVAMSAHIFEEEKQESLTAGMNDYITKPIRIDKLKTVLHQQLGGNSALPDRIGNLDIIKIMKDHDNDEHFTIMILASFNTRIKEIESRIISAVKGESLEDLLFHVHSLRGMAGLVECEALLNLTTQIEEEIHHSEMEKIPADVELLLSEIRTQVESLQEYEEIFRSI